MADPGDGKRRYPRYFADLDIIIYRAQNSIHGRIRQISRGGCLVVPPLTLVLDGALRISFRLGDDSPYINCKGEIVYSFPDKGTGVAFTEISMYNQDMITAFFEKGLAVEDRAKA